MGVRGCLDVVDYSKSDKVLVYGEVEISILIGMEIDKNKQIEGIITTRELKEYKEILDTLGHILEGDKYLTQIREELKGIDKGELKGIEVKHIRVK